MCIQLISNKPRQKKKRFLNICENNGPDLTVQFISSFVFLHGKYDFSSSSILNFKTQASFGRCTARFKSDLVRHPENQFSDIYINIHHVLQKQKSTLYTSMSILKE